MKKKIFGKEKILNKLNQAKDSVFKLYDKYSYKIKLAGLAFGGFALVGPSLISCDKETGCKLTPKDGYNIVDCQYVPINPGEQPGDPIKKEDIFVPYTIGSINTCNDGNYGYTYQLAGDRIDSLKKLPTTGNIIPYVICRDNRGPPPQIMKNFIEHLTTLKNNGLVEFRPDTIYVNDFYYEDSVKAATELKLLIDKYSRHN